MTSRRFHRTKFAAALAITALTLAACGGTDSELAASPVVPAVAPAEAPAVTPAATPSLTPALPTVPRAASADTASAAEKSQESAAKGRSAQAPEESAGTEKAAEPAPEPAPEPAGPLATLPDLQVVDVNTGKTANLRTFATSGMPTLLWFWAPHCVFCRAEAPKVVEFAKKYEGRIQVLGLGAQDSFDEAEGFIDDTSTQGLTMVWDASGKSWLHYKVTNQPTVIVLNAEGKATRTWFRDFDEAGIVKAAEKA